MKIDVEGAEWDSFMATPETLGVSGTGSALGLLPLDAPNNPKSRDCQ